MFTGIIQMMGVFERSSLSGGAGKLSLRTPVPLPEPVCGESIAVNGACLTLEKAHGTRLSFHVMKETFDRTNLGALRRGDALNLERALMLRDRLGGHLVTGHVDGCAPLLAVTRQDADTELTLALPESVREFLVPKGSIAVNGVSLTLARLEPDCARVRIIPTTWRETNLSLLNVGDSVNLEADLLGKYIRHQLTEFLDSGENAPARKKLSLDDLLQAGF